MALQKLKTLVKIKFTSKFIMFEKKNGIHASHHHMLWKVENYHFTTNSSKIPNVGHCRSSHIMLELCGHELCYELVLWSLVVWCFNYCHYPNYQATSWTSWNDASFRWDISFGSIWFKTHFLPKKDVGRSCEGF
jgi:hypothetical protein